MHRNDVAVALVVLFSVLIFIALLKKILRCLEHRPATHTITIRIPDVEREYPQIHPEQLDTTRTMDQRHDSSEGFAYYVTCPEEDGTKNAQSEEPPEYSENLTPYSDHVEGPPNSPTAYGTFTLQPRRLVPTGLPLGPVDELECLPGAMYPIRPGALFSEVQVVEDTNGPAFLRWGNRRLAPSEYLGFGADHIFRGELEEKVLEPVG